ncbi:MAG: hypothetical protein ACREE4_02435 [Stellaceae bacterium]
MPSLSMNLVKRVERLPKPVRTAEALLPLFEAISNSIHSTQDKYGDEIAGKGRVEITVITGRRQAPVKIVVEDNGIGLDQKNFEAFLTTDTDNKIRIGGKGVGRLLWLDCFEHIHLDSYYKTPQGDLRRRRFDFQLAADDQITNYEETEPEGTPLGTGVTITFEGLRDNGYRGRFPGRHTYIFQHVTSHFLPIFVGRRSPRIIVHSGDETRDFPAAMEEVILRLFEVKDIDADVYGTMQLTLMECDKVASSDLPGSHFVHFIAHDRTVHSQRIDGRLGLKFFGIDNNRVFHALLFGDFLDRHVNQERTSFTFDDAVIEKIVNDVCVPHITRFLEEPLARLKQNQEKVVQRIVGTYPSVAFASSEEMQKWIPTGELSDDAIYGHLSRERYRRDARQGEKIRGALNKLRGKNINETVFSSTLMEVSKAIEETEQRSLAEYVVRRKVVLDFLEILIQNVRDDNHDSSYQREDVLHSFICPMRVNTLEGGEKKVTAASHDLWVIDERLTFAQYFSSDAPFTELARSVDSQERPDILIFDKVHSLRQTEHPSKVLVVEFKKPGRTGYADSENPHQQIERYVRRLLEGGQIDVRGRPIELRRDTVFYCFIVADIIGRMDEWTYSWERTADGRGRLYQPRSGFSGSIELISWDSLLTDARERNRAFFDRAGISGKSLFTID